METHDLDPKSDSATSKRFSRAVNPGIPVRPESMYLGLGTDDDIVWNSPHILVTGAAGTGKTVFLQNLVEQCRVQNWIVLVIDGDSRGTGEWMPGRNLDTVNDLSSSVHMLNEALSIMKSRYTVMEEEGMNIYSDSKANLIPILVVIDALDTLVSLEENRLADDSTHFRTGELLTTLSHLARLGRAAGIHLAVSGSPSITDLITTPTLLDLETRLDISESESSLRTALLKANGRDEEIQLYGPVP